MTIIKLSKEKKQELIDEVIEQIIEDVTIGDVTAIDELLQSTSVDSLVGYLAEGDAKKYIKE
jgi:hypothetical protein